MSSSNCGYRLLRVFGLLIDLAESRWPPQPTAGENDRQRVERPALRAARAAREKLEEKENEQA